LALISKPNTFAASETIVAAEHNSNFDTIYSEFNGSISNANIDGSAAIADSKLAQLTTASKVALSALATSGTYAPSGAWSPSGAWIHTGTIDVTAAPLLGASPLVFEGATADAFETSVTVTDPTADRTLTVPDEDINLGQQCVKAWVNFQGSSTISDSFNVTSITDNGIGDFTVTWATDFANANYAVVGMCKSDNTSDGTAVSIKSGTSLAAGTCTVTTIQPTTGVEDSNPTMLIAIGDQS
jgi:hypothetical protein